jgi:hypothetical protein
VPFYVPVCGNTFQDFFLFYFDIYHPFLPLRDSDPVESYHPGSGNCSVFNKFVSMGNSAIGHGKALGRSMPEACGSSVLKDINKRKRILLLR